MAGKLLAREECGHRYRLQLGDGALLVQCDRQQGHEGEHRVRLYRAEVAWPAEDLTTLGGC